MLRTQNPHSSHEPWGKHNNNPLTQKMRKKPISLQWLLSEYFHNRPHTREHAERYTGT